MEYLTELTQGPLREYFRPHFFVNTPDINPFLHEGGRPAFLIRAALAALLSGLWACTAASSCASPEPLVVDGKVREEYLDSGEVSTAPAQLAAARQHRRGDHAPEPAPPAASRPAEPSGAALLPCRQRCHLVFRAPVPGEETLFGDDVLLVAINSDPRHAQEAPSRFHYRMGPA